MRAPRAGHRPLNVTVTMPALNALREIVLAQPASWLAWGGFAIGAVFGAVVHLTRFCAMGALSDLASFGDTRRLRAWILATVVAVVGAQTLQSFDVVALERSMYLTPRLNWLGNLLGGALFGLGMVFAGGCGSRNLVRAGAGDLRSFVVLGVIGWTAYLTIGGILGPLRVALESHTALALGGAVNQGMPAIVAALAGGEASAWRWPVTVAVAGAGFIYCFAGRDFRSSPLHVLGGLGVGACVITAWALTGLAYDEFAATPLAPQGLSFVRPVGDAMDYLARWSAAPMPVFTVASVFGTLVGAHLGARANGQFRWSGFADRGDTVRNLLGGALMGVGGVVALGCTIGQAITGVSTLAVGSLLTFAALAAGGLAGLRALERWIE